MKRFHLSSMAALLALAALCSSSPSFARDYLVEVVLFETLAGRNTPTGSVYFPKTQGSIRLESDEAVNAGFKTMEQGLTLSENAATISASSRYRLLRHLAWRQPGLDSDDAKALRISLGDTSTVYLPDQAAAQDAFIPAYAQPSEGRTTEVKTSTLNGTIKVRLGRFLHMDCQLIYTDASTQQSYRLQQSRKMRSGELHYIDNPRFGLLTRITPLQEEESESSNASAAAEDNLDTEPDTQPTAE